MKRVFISHSSADGDVAKRLCTRLEAIGQPCWIAPRDIEYGEKWAEQIAYSLINDTGMFVFLLSENSNKSDQVLKEINIALNYDIPMLIIGIDKVEKMNLSLVYYLSNLHIYSCEADDEERMIALVQGKYAHRDAAARQKGQGEKAVYCKLSEAINNEFQRQRPVTPDSFHKQLCKIINRNLLSSWEAFQLNDPTRVDAELSEMDDPGFSEKEELDLSGPFGEKREGMYFSLPGTLEQDTQVYQVNRNINPNTYECYYSLELLDSCVQIVDEQMIIQTFFVENPAPDGNHIVFITIDDVKKLVIITEGFIDYDHIKIAKASNVMSNFPTYSQKSIHTFFEGKEETNYQIIDVQTHLPAGWKDVFDEEAGIYRTVLDLQPGKQYMAFSVTVTNNVKKRASDAEIGYAYYCGAYGLPVNWFLAAESFLKSEDPRSFFYLGVIFWKDPLLHDFSLAKEYFLKARENGIDVSDAILNELKDVK